MGETNVIGELNEEPRFTRENGMQFAIIAKDHTVAGTLEKRLAARTEHMEGIRQGKAEGTIIDGGAILNAQGNMAGSVILCEFPDRAALDAYFAAEPYHRDGIWGAVEVLEFRRVDWAKLMGQA
ncbi:YciI family protein [Rhizobium rhizogenes]|uniref:YciI family protein n=1 Tax=Rhizobium rhizogenes TaxID=359 RepID=UPI001F474276|nr:YciI family protein [Rhizobium rhizogenes]